jgi:4-hydroxy-tetrahydrodipicolinate reductase
MNTKHLPSNRATKPTGAQVTKVVCVGLGAIGMLAFEECLKADDLQVVAAVDPARAGSSLGDLEVREAIADLRGIEADVAILATGSDVDRVKDEIDELLACGFNVTSTCEPLAFPFAAYGVASNEIDAAARAAGKAVIASGVNPGFTMDVLPTTVATVCGSVDSMLVRRTVDLSRRRRQLGKKLGAGLSEPEWRAAAATGEVTGHAGLVESALLCAQGLRWTPEAVGELEREPVIERGTVVGIRESVAMTAREGGDLRLELLFSLNGRDEDRVEISGQTPVTLVVSGIHGDLATVARALHTARMAPRMRPGLRLPLEVPAWLPAVRVSATEWEAGARSAA